MTVGTTNGRCGYSQRLPMVVISPYTRENYVSSNLTDTASVVKFIEDNWLHGERIPGSFDTISGSLDARAGCSTSTPARTSRRSSSTRRPAPWSAAATGRATACRRARRRELAC